MGVLETGVFVVAWEAPADAFFDEATTADLPPLPVGFTGVLDVEVLFVVDDFGVAGNFRRSFCALVQSPVLEFEFCAGGVGVVDGVGANEEAFEDGCD